MLRSNNGWVRDRAQQLLLERNAKGVTQKLVEFVKDDRNGVTAVHALYTLEGLN